MTINITGTYVLGAGQHLAFSNQGALVLDGSSGTPNATIQGSVQDNAFTTDPSQAVSAAAFKDNVGGSDLAGSLIEIALGGSVTVNTSGGPNFQSQASGYLGFQGARLENDGSLTVSSSDGPAVGVGQFYLYTASDNNSFSTDVYNTGTLQVSGNAAAGVSFQYEGTVKNTGSFTVTGGHAGATGIVIDQYGGNASVYNSGNLIVSASGGGPSVGVFIAGAYALGHAMPITNSGTITAGTAIQVDNSASPNPTPIIDLNNSGTINGDIVLGQGPASSNSAGSQITNTGAIHGNIQFDNGDASYLGGGGTISGTITFGSGASNYAELGADGEHLIGESGDDTIVGGAGNDVIDGGGGSNTVNYAHATSGVTVSLAAQGAAQDTLGAGSDTLSNFQNLAGSTFNDTLVGDGSDNAIQGGAGADTISGGAGNDSLYGGTGNDTLQGGAGNDYLDGGPGNDVIDGGTGYNVVSYSAAPSAVNVNLSLNGVAQDTGGAGIDTLSNLQAVLGSAFDDSLTAASTDSVIYGGAGADTIRGGAGNDSLFGGAGNDYVDGGGGVDVMDGGLGWNIVSYQSASAGAEVNLSQQGTWQDTIGSGYAFLTNFQAVMGSNFNDTLIGDGSDNNLYGMDGADTLYGGAGNDDLFGGNGNDYIDGGAGHDVIDGGAGWNIASYQSATSFVVVDLNDHGVIQDTQGAGFDTISNIQALMGSNFDDTLIGDTADNVLYGMAGNDTLYGGAGNDSLYGGAGNDYLDGGSGNDTIDGGTGFNILSYGSATSGVTVNLALQGSAQDTHGDGIDTISNVENLIGSGFNDTLTGDSLTNVIYGGAGDDVITGGGGLDKLFGGAGNNTFVYTATSDSTQAAADVIGDFAAGDRIDVSAVDADTGTAGDQAFHVGGGGGHAGDIVVTYDGVHNKTLLDFYTNNTPTIAMEIILLGNHAAIAAGDFVL